MSADGDKKLEKELNARRRACMDREVTHLRLGDWRGPAIRSISLIGMAGDLHGSVCSCCPQRPGSTGETV